MYTPGWSGQTPHREGILPERSRSLGMGSGAPIDDFRAKHRVRQQNPPEEHVSDPNVPAESTPAGRESAPAYDPLQPPTGLAVPAGSSQPPYQQPAPAQPAYAQPVAAQPA